MGTKTKEFGPNNKTSKLENGAKNGTREKTLSCYKLVPIVWECLPGGTNEIWRKVRGRVKTETKPKKARIIKVLEMLKEMGLVKVVEEGQKKIHVKKLLEFKKAEEYAAHLNHSKRLFSTVFSPQDIAFYVPYLKRRIKKTETNVKVMLLQHIKNGYHHIFREFEKLYQLMEESKAVKETLKKKLVTYLKKHRFVFVKPENKTKNAIYIENLEKLLFEELVQELVTGIKFTVKEGFVVCNLYPALKISGDAKLKERLEKAVNGFIKKNKKSVEQLVVLEKRIASKTNALKKELRYLKEKVKHGEPLAGICQLCPRVIIKEKNEH